MRRSLQFCYVLISSCVLLVNCRKKTWDEYYSRPASLEPPIYQQLENNGNFKLLLSCVDKAGYKNTLSAAGYWTLFAPDDNAFNSDQEFKSFLQGRGVSDVKNIDTATAQMIVQYLLVYNAFEKDKLDDYQAPTGWIVNSAFKRRTAYYTGFYKDTTLTGLAVQAIASNRNNTNGANYYISSDNNNKYIPIFTDTYLAAKGLSSADYNYFYPNTGFSGFNVANAKVTQQNVAAENGVIHFIDHVVTPPPSIDQYLKTKPEFSAFKKLFDQYMVQYIQNADATHRYNVLTGNQQDVMVKVYNTLLAFSPNNENHLKLQDNDGQRDGWTLFAPQNDSLNAYIQRVLYKYYTPANLPTQIIADLLNAHMWQTTVWPSKFSSTYNYMGEPAALSSQTNVIDKKLLSNGIFYGTNKVNEPSVFSSVYGKAYLNPKFSLMTRLLNSDLKDVITNNKAKFTIFMMSDSLLNSQGYSYNSATSLWKFVNPATGASSENDSNRINLLRILNTSVIETPHDELKNLRQLNTSGIIASYGSEYIRYDGNKITTAGTKDKGITVTIDSVLDAKNGQVVFVSNLLYFSYAPIGYHMQALATSNPEYSYFWNYLKNAPNMYDATTGAIGGTTGGNFYTILAPNNAAVLQAVADGLLPGTPGAPNFNPTVTAEKNMVEKFLQYHIVDKKTIIDVIDLDGDYATLLRNSGGDAITVNVDHKATGSLTLKDGFSRVCHLIPSESNQLSNRCVIHLMDNYLKYY